MQKFLTLLFVVMTLYQVKAQTLFSQDFESGSIAPMTAIDVDGKILDQNVGGLSPTWDVFQTDAFNRSAISTSWFAPPGQCDDWLISPSIEITQANTFLIWEASSYGAAPYREAYQVMVSTTGNDSLSKFTDVLFETPGELNETQKHALRFDNYIGKTIHFAFRNNSYDKWLMFLDNIEVRILKNEDVIVKSVNFEKYNPVNSTIPVKITIFNNGANPLTTFEYTWTVGNSTYTDTVTSFNLSTVQTTEVSHEVAYDVTQAGEFPLLVDLSKPNGVDDSNPYDNVGTRTIYGMSEQLPKKIVVEEGTGTWCGFCPRGFVTMELIGQNFSDIAIPIAVHNDDPMAVTEYDGYFSNTISGYPNGHVDRKEIGIDPNDPNTGYGFINAIDNLKTRMVPVAVKTETAYDPDTRIVHITGTGHLSIPTEANNLRFVCVITEDSVRGTGALYDQVNYYSGGQLGVMGGFENLADPVPAVLMVYNFVARAILGGFFGLENSIPKVLEANEDFEVEYNYEVPLIYDVDHMKAIVFVLDDETGEILNADVTDVNQTTAVPFIPQGRTVLFPNPASEEMNLTVDFKSTANVTLMIYDQNGRLIQNLGNLDLSGGVTSQKINISTLHTGSYILEIRHKNSVTALPFTKI